MGSMRSSNNKSSDGPGVFSSIWNSVKSAFTKDEKEKLVAPAKKTAKKEMIAQSDAVQLKSAPFNSIPKTHELKR